MPSFTRSLALGLAAVALTALPAAAQTKLKWAHVYETAEPFHTQSVWAAQEIAKRTNNRYQIDVYPASQLGKETDINQGLSLGTVDIIISGPSFAARSFPPIGIGYYPYVFRDAGASPRLRQERRVQGAERRLLRQDRPPDAGRDLLRHAPHRPRTRPSRPAPR